MEPFRVPTLISIHWTIVLVLGGNRGNHDSAFIALAGVAGRASPIRRLPCRSGVARRGFALAGWGSSAPGWWPAKCRARRCCWWEQVCCSARSGTWSSRAWDSDNRAHHDAKPRRCQRDAAGFSQMAVSEDTRSAPVSVAVLTYQPFSRACAICRALRVRRSRLRRCCREWISVPASTSSTLPTDSRQQTGGDARDPAVSGEFARTLGTLHGAAG